MDAETRHQLKQNELAEAIGRLREMKDPKFMYTVAGILLVAVIYVGWYGWQSSTRHAAEQDWQQLSDVTQRLFSTEPAEARTAQEEMRALIRDTSDPGLGGYARLKLAEAHIQEAFDDAEQRPAGFEEAATLLEEIVANQRTPGMLQAVAKYALATTYESLGRVDDARQQYEELSDAAQFAGSPYQELAVDRLETMDTLATNVTFEPGQPPAPETAPASGLAPFEMPPGIQVNPVTDPETLKRLEEGVREKPEGEDAEATPPAETPEEAPAAGAAPADEPDDAPAEEPPAENPESTP
jgi:predicted negative regulator of RcsB-dependent stress response